MKLKFYFLTVMLFLLSQTGIFAQDPYILIVGSSADDQSVVDILTDEGYDVKRGKGTYTGILSQEKLDSLDNADLVIFSRNGSTGGHGDDSATPGLSEQWAAVQAPMISLSPWIMRSSRWKWINSTAVSCAQSDILTVAPDGEDSPIFEGVDISSGNVDWTLPGTTRNELFVLSDELNVGNGMVLALDTNANREGLMICEWEEGYPFYDEGPVPASTRMWLCISEGDNCKEDGNIMSAFNGTDDGAKILKNAVAYMIQSGKVGVNDLKSETQLVVFPNPTTDVLSISGLRAEVCYEIFSVSGKVVQQGITNRNINVSGLQKGMYILSTSTNQKCKFIKE